MSPFSDPLYVQVILTENLGKKGKLLMSELWDFYLPWVSAFSKKTLKEIANSHTDEGSLKGVGAKFIMVGVGKQGTTSKLHIPFPCIQSSRAAKATQVNLVSTNK